MKNTLRFTSQYAMFIIIVTSALFETSGVTFGWSIPREVSKVTVPKDYPPNASFHQIIPLPEMSDSRTALFFEIRKVQIHPRGRRLRTKPLPVGIDNNTGHLWLENAIDDTGGDKRQNLTITVGVSGDANSTHLWHLRTSVTVLFSGNMSTFCEPGHEKCFPGDSNFYTMRESSLPGLPFDNLLHEGVRQFCSQLSISYSTLIENSTISVSHTTGVLSLKNELDAEVSHSEVLCISCLLKWDEKSLEFNSTLHLDVIDINDNTPTSQSGETYINYNFTIDVDEDYLDIPLSVIDLDTKEVNRLRVKIVNDTLDLFKVKNTNTFWYSHNRSFTFFHANIQPRKSVKFNEMSYKFFVVFEDQKFSTIKNSEVIYEIDIVNSSYLYLGMRPVISQEKYESINVSVNSAVLTRIIRLTPKELFDKTMKFKIISDSAKNWLGLTEKSGILFFKNKTFLEEFQPGDVAEVNIFWHNLEENGSMSIQLQFYNTENETLECDRPVWCALFANERRCTEYCGLGAVEGQCQWYDDNPPSPDRHYRTCSPDLSTCPDGQCDELEEAYRYICPQDCASSVFGEAIPNKSGFGIKEAIGPCSCPSPYTCICMQGYTGEMNDSSETPPTNLAVSSNPFSMKQANHGSTESSTTTTEDDRKPSGDQESFCGTKCISITTSGIAAIIILIPIPIFFLRRMKNREYLSRHIPLSAMHYGYVERRSAPRQNTHINDDRGNDFVVHPRWKIPRENLRFKGLLGEGAFGKVLKARVWNINGQNDFTTVAVKMLKAECVSPKDEQDFFSEFLSLTEIRHPNIIRLLGACSDRHNPFYIVVEYAELGSLRNYLRENYLRHHPDGSERVINWNSKIEHELLSYSWQIAKGMTYLAQIKIVHRDLAARNVLLTGEKVIKISDFGLSRDVYEGETYLKKSRSRVPVKWMAIESLERNIYSTLSDVWSFGIVFWEIMSLGAMPYMEFGADRLYTMLKNGYRLRKPLHCSAKSYEIMITCWQESPCRRPSFRQLTKMLEPLMIESTPYLDLETAGPSHGPETYRQSVATLFGELPRLNYAKLASSSDDEAEYVPESVGYQMSFSDAQMSFEDGQMSFDEDQTQVKTLYSTNSKKC